MSETKQAPHPFNQDSADVTLRTSDGVDFHVHMAILIQASEHFRTMFTLPQPEQPGGTRPIVDIDETSQTLQLLLTICYPIVKAKPRPFAAIEPAFRAALKYEMELAIECLKEDLCEGVDKRTDFPAFPVWALASRLKLEDVGRAASKRLLILQLDQMEESAVVLSGVTAANYFRLRHHLQVWFSDTQHHLFAPPEPPTDAQTSSHSDRGVETCFEPLPYPDLVCRSSSEVDFQVQRSVLAGASSQLRARIDTAIESASDTAPPTLPIITFVEDDSLLRSMLDVCCYMRADRLPSSAAELVPIISLAKKYDIEQAMDLLRTRWLKISEDSPLAACLLADSAGLTDFVKLAAPMLLRQPHTIFTVYDPVMETTSALTYQHLMVYHQRCAAAVDQKLAQIKKENPPPPPSPPTNFPPGPSPHLQPTKFWARPSKVDWFLSTFLDQVIRDGSRGPYGKILAVKELPSRYVRWRADGHPITPEPQQSQFEACTIAQLSESLPGTLGSVLEGIELPKL